MPLKQLLIKQIPTRGSMRSFEGIRLVLHLALHLASPRPRLLCGEAQNVLLLFSLVKPDPSCTRSSGPVFLTSASLATGHGHLSRPPPHVCLHPFPLGPVLIDLFWQPFLLSSLPQTFICQLPLCQGLC